VVADEVGRFRVDETVSGPVSVGGSIDGRPVVTHRFLA